MGNEGALVCPGRVGRDDTTGVGWRVGASVGLLEAIDGLAVGLCEGCSLGRFEGREVGSEVGRVEGVTRGPVGEGLGLWLGGVDGCSLGCFVGNEVGRVDGVTRGSVGERVDTSGDGLGLWRSEERRVGKDA